MIPAIMHGGTWLLNENIQFDRPVEIWVDTVHPVSHLFSYKVNITSFEPEYFRCNNFEVIQHQKRFDLLLCHDPALLNCKNAELFLFGSSWISDDNALSVINQDKKFGVSFVCGGKTELPGHQLRHKLWRRQKEITKNKAFYVSSQFPVPVIDNNPVLPKDGQLKTLLFESMFHVAIENTKIDNYFSEKVCDCFKTKTVPIYYGCPNIGKYFDEKGIIQVNSESDIIEVCNSLTPEKYAEMAEALENNRILMKEYDGPLEPRIVKAINRRLDELA